MTCFSTLMPKGDCFAPVSRAPEPLYVATKHKGLLSSLNGMRILVAGRASLGRATQYNPTGCIESDDESDHRTAVELLKTFGITVDVVDNGREAIARLEQHFNYDLVLTDFEMPVMDGALLIRLIRSDTQYTALPVIAMIESGTDDDRKRNFDSGFNVVLTKPIEPDYLLRTLARYGVGRKVEESEVIAPALQRDPIFSVPGLDVAGGIKRTAGNEELYRKLLRQFLTGQSNTMKEIRAALSGGNFLSATRLLHTLKGVAGNIGAISLAQLSSEAEDSIVERPDGEGIYKLLDILDQVFNDLCSALSRSLGCSDESGDGAVTQAPTQIVIQKLVDALQQNDGCIVDYVEAHTKILRDIFPASQFDALIVSIQNYDFSTALGLVRSLNISNGGGIHGRNSKQGI